MELRVFPDKLGQDGALGLDGNAVAKGLIVTAEAHIERGVILRLFQKVASFQHETTRAYNTHAGAIIP